MNRQPGLWLGRTNLSHRLLSLFRVQRPAGLLLIASASVTLAGERRRARLVEKTEELEKRRQDLEGTTWSQCGGFGHRRLGWPIDPRVRGVNRATPS